MKKKEREKREREKKERERKKREKEREREREKKKKWKCISNKEMVFFGGNARRQPGNQVAGTTGGSDHHVNETTTKEKPTTLQVQVLVTFAQHLYTTVIRIKVPQKPTCLVWSGLSVCLGISFYLLVLGLTD